MAVVAPPPESSLSLFELYLDLPHPGASGTSPKPFLIPSPLGTSANSSNDELIKNLGQIARFAFPEYEGEEQPQPQAVESSSRSPIPYLNRYDLYAMQNKGFQHFTFTMQLRSGQRIYGHVRRYLPPHMMARQRYDVGRRGERALIVMTRVSGADLLFQAILKSLDAISSQQAVLPPELASYGEPQKAFMYELHKHHQYLVQAYAAQPLEQRGKPLVANLPGIEFGPKPLFARVDTTRFIFPTYLLRPIRATDPSTSQSSALMPLLRCVGVEHSLRIMSALLSERRVIIVSSSPTRLATCSHAALGMLAQGLLHWQHLYIPVMPPHLWQYLAAPYPYLIGILTQSLPKLDRTDGLGEVLMINLDNNTMETRNMDQRYILQRLPDLFQNLDQTAGTVASPSEDLAQSLQEILKQDKKILNGESALGNVSETAAKATKAVKNTFVKLRNKGRQYLSGKSTSGISDEDKEALQSSSVPEEKSLAADYIYTESCYNEIAEEDARISFTCFFLCMFGNMRWYLSQAPGQNPQLDRNRFLQQKREMGEGEGTAMWPLLQNFCQTQMLEEFAKARIEEVRTREPITPDTPLFVRCAAYHREHNVSFDILTVRRVTQQVAQNSPARITGMPQTNARQMAMTLTSNKVFEGDYGAAVGQLVEKCRESTSVLFDVMSVIWLRLRDSKGMQWKHAYQALQILKNLLYHGPLAVIAEATDGLDKIRAMKFYENMRQNVVSDIRNSATYVYYLLVDRSKLYRIRRFCAEKRRLLQNPPPTLVRDNRLSITGNFRAIHAALNPNNRGTYARLPPTAPQHVPMSRGEGADLFGAPGQPPGQPNQMPQPAAINSDLIGLFDNVQISGQPLNAKASPSSGNPFDAMQPPPSIDPSPETSAAPSPVPQQQSQPPPSFQPTPTIVALPPNPAPRPYSQYPPQQQFQQPHPGHIQPIHHHHHTHIPHQNSGYPVNPSQTHGITGPSIQPNIPPQQIMPPGQIPPPGYQVNQPAPPPSKAQFDPFA